MYILSPGTYIPSLETHIPYLGTERAAMDSPVATATRRARIMAAPTLLTMQPTAVVATAVFLLANHFAMLFFLTKFAL